MAAELVGGAFISASIQLLLERIASLDVKSYLWGNNNSDLDGLLKRLKIMVSSLTAVLDDAEQRQIRNESRVEAWLDEVQEAVLDADGLLDEIETDALQAGTSEVRETKKRKIFNLFSRSRSTNDGDLENRIRKFLDRLEEIAKQKDLLCLKENFVEEKRWPRSPSTSLVEESQVYGRDDDKEVVIKLLLSDDVGLEKMLVLPIVGMGGIGKTTLAQAVFNHYEVREKFQLKAWVCVSEEYDALRVTKTIVKIVSQCPCDDAMDLNSLQVKLRESLTGKKFLIVLDDVWNENYLDWDILRMPFKDGARGSKIIVSTRSNKVANIMGTVRSHQLKELSEEACWQLFSRHVSGIGDLSTANPELQRIGREIVGKCKGLPLAVKTLGGLLRSTFDVGEWEKVSKSDIWELTDVQSNILRALRLSYYYLPSALKRCFAYCSIFPKDYEFEKEELILLWMAENFLQDPKGNKKMEDVGDEYFHDLVSRSILQSRNANDKSVFVMHDLLVDLAKSVSNRHCFLLETSGSSDAVVMPHARHFSYISEQRNLFQRFNFVFEDTSSRTFLPLRVGLYCTLSEDSVDELFLKLRCLRVLSLSGYKNIRKLPDSIGDLRHLRYLNVSLTSISCLPESTSKLYNLQTLKLEKNKFLVKLPKDFHHLVNLRHLDVSDTGLKELPPSLRFLSNLHTLKLFDSLSSSRYIDADCYKIKEMPTQISKLTNLQSLSTFIVGKDKGTKIGELGNLSNLRGTLHIKSLQNMVKPDDALGANLKEKKNLEKLKFEWDFHVSSASMHEMVVLDNLMPCTSLKKLEITRYGGTNFPNWLGYQSFCNVVDVHLSKCNHCVALPPLGQLPSLKKLNIERFDAVVTVGPEFCGNSSSTPFPSLEILEFYKMPNWKEWSMPDGDAESFPKLRILHLIWCSSLTSDLPCFLPSLTELRIFDGKQLASSLPAMPKATKLTLEECSENIVRSVEALESFSCLQTLEITGNSLSLEFRHLPAALKTLRIFGSRSFELQLKQQFYDSLEELSFGCYKGFFRPSFALDLFPNIRVLKIAGCQNLESLWALSNGQSFESLISLSTLHLQNCRDSTLFLCTLPNLTSFKVESCKKLKFLPEQMHNLLPSLESLDINYCLELESFPKAGLPVGLRRLHIQNCDKLMASRRNWNLQRLPNLLSITILDFGCEDMESFPEEGLLPNTITQLNILAIKRLKILDNKGLQQLTSLKHLCIHICPDFQTMSKEELPSSLASLQIIGCPLVEKKCQRGIGEYWNKIAHIPYIDIEHQSV